MLKDILVIFYFLVSSKAFAGLTLQIEAIHKKGIDKGLILTSELHAIEDLAGRKEVRLKMKNGITIFLKASSVQQDNDFGPSSTVVLTGDIFDNQGKKVKSFDDANIITELGKSKLITYQDQDKDQILEIKILPFMQ